MINVSWRKVVLAWVLTGAVAAGGYGALQVLRPDKVMTADKISEQIVGGYGVPEFYAITTAYCVSEKTDDQGVGTYFCQVHGHAPDEADKRGVVFVLVDKQGKWITQSEWMPRG